MKQGSPEWLQFRRTKIGASDAPVIMGVSPWMSPLKLYEQKVYGIECPDNQYMARGRELEPVALMCFEEMFELTMFSMVIVHELYYWMSASMDGMTIEKDKAVEIKCAGKRDHFMAANGIVPEKYIPQLQHQMEVCQLGEINYFSFDGKQGVNIIVERDQNYIDKLLDKEKEFWQCLQTLTPPVLYE
jgi:putative phage-type endonuclease